MDVLSGTLYIVATPIGNFSDITERAREVLGTVDIVLAEDTRRTGMLLSHLGIKAITMAFHEHNEREKTDNILQQLKEGRQIALVSDAGTPLIRDPGYPLVQACYQHNIRVSPIPGPCAAISALSASGIATDTFLFLGYLPAKRIAREKALAKLVSHQATLIFYEAPHRIVEFMQSLQVTFPVERQVCIAREITKVHEQFYRGDLVKVTKALENNEIPVLGEFIVVLAGNSIDSPDDNNKQDLEKILTTLLEKLTVKEAVELAMKLTDEKKNKLYSMALEINNDKV